MSLGTPLLTGVSMLHAGCCDVVGCGPMHVRGRCGASLLPMDRLVQDRDQGKCPFLCSHGSLLKEIWPFWFWQWCNAKAVCDYRSRLLSAFGTDAMPRLFLCLQILPTVSFWH
jgi:hypothetical protein